MARATDGAGRMSADVGCRWLTGQALELQGLLINEGDGGGMWQKWGLQMLLANKAG